eukprot:CAMPEP_0197191656 /NCGR_PEP_ID=MMETSP1423-20130617/23759_1 /TAXON_ID=476441 /ORGANISM="Pseudo-nitzschia heimii, Strain UNC1101" /LENGTH=138 /DNA_ID=CAMNT_0042644353 /DNA_START=392 /DNA_END=804 /DNA_ORIENTATION=-
MRSVGPPFDEKSTRMIPENSSMIPSTVQASPPEEPLGEHPGVPSVPETSTGRALELEMVESEKEVVTATIDRLQFGWFGSLYSDRNEPRLLRGKAFVCPAAPPSTTTREAAVSGVAVACCCSDDDETFGGIRSSSAGS